ncbi:carboxylesterase family protein [Sphingobium sp. DEHP117]|uniref:carboxylesterase/lipase family protein n=1 Tax=Sphingobium sp. DEHP117 TaxID=2993436 RepID=UPI0027D6DA07|nr:carboxylesterase family protein [Sphingobium sp. DEHP117]MDQ4419038.1 carboxylesterase family protein [Sphingobium sp. DEHP117]
MTDCTALVETPDGPLLGTRDGSLDAFLGIAYALPPVGERRWRPPVPVPPWTETRRADAFGPACWQPKPRTGSIYAERYAQMSEDCLSLNIWAPTHAKDAPVLVWFHGGALVTGSSCDSICHGAALARLGVIVVSINYRLGIFGYLAHPSLSAESADDVSGNYGLLDQIEALRWVRRNIAAFGGNPDDVTIAGESAGALSVLFLMACPAARGLFAKAIAQSAYMISMPELKTPRHGHEAAEVAGTRFCRQVGCDTIDELREWDADRLNAAAAEQLFETWGTIDGVILPRQLIDTFERGEQAPVPVLAGFNSGEIRSIRFLAPDVPQDQSTYEPAIRERYGDLADEYLRLYPPHPLEESLLAATRDAMYGWTAERIVAGQTALGQSSFLYLFDHTYPEADRLGLHAFHAGELPFVFGSLQQPPMHWPKIEDSAAERAMSDAMMHYWVAFATHGSPDVPDLPQWHPYADRRSYMAFQDRPRPDVHLFPGAFELNDEVIRRRRAGGNIPWNWNVGLNAPLRQFAGGVEANRS